MVLLDKQLCWSSLYSCERTPRWASQIETSHPAGNVSQTTTWKRNDPSWSHGLVVGTRDYVAKQFEACWYQPNVQKLTGKMTVLLTIELTLYKNLYRFWSTGGLLGHLTYKDLWALFLFTTYCRQLGWPLVSLFPYCFSFAYQCTYKGTFGEQRAK